jgi:flavorubredoxin
MWNSTRKMAEAIARGIESEDPEVKIKLMNASKEDKNDVITEVFKSKLILMGAPTVNNGYLFSLGGLLEMMKGLKFKNKKAATFGSYGWSGEAVKLLSDHLKDAGFNIVNDGLRKLWVPDEDSLEDCSLFGVELIRQCKN